MNYLLIIVTLLIISIIVLGLIHVFKHNVKELYNTNTNSYASTKPYKNNSLSAYDKLDSFISNTNAQNLVSNKNLPKEASIIPQNGYDPKFYASNSVCVTPANQQCVTNDSCAQYGIGETCIGPEGNKFCICVANKNNNKIDIAGVCSENSQCFTNHCTSIPGQFSKLCQCPSGFQWDIQNQKCISELYPTKDSAIMTSLDRKNLNTQSPGYSAITGKNVQMPYQGIQQSSSKYSSIWDPMTESYPSMPVGSLLNTGVLCKSNLECGLGEACTPDGFCASQIVPDNELDANKIILGGNCQNDSQCSHNLKCIMPSSSYKQSSSYEQSSSSTLGVCRCPPALSYDYTSRTCQCPDGTMTYLPLNEKCVSHSQVPRTICPSNPLTICDTNKECGLGERCNPSTKQCMCVADLHTEQIYQGGNCKTTDQCKSGSCNNFEEQSFCIDNL